MTRYVIDNNRDYLHVHHDFQNVCYFEVWLSTQECRYTCSSRIIIFKMYVISRCEYLLKNIVIHALDGIIIYKMYVISRYDYILKNVVH